MSESFSPQISDRICRHMNEDHAEAVLMYAKVFGKTTTATGCRDGRDRRAWHGFAGASGWHCYTDPHFV
jgi:putative heme iron utilization protein